MAVVTKDIWTTLKELLIEQYRANLRTQIEAEGCTLPTGADNRLQGLLKAVIDELIQPLDDAAVAMQNILDIDGASGSWLDVIGKITGVKRGAEESDASYRTRMKSEVVLNKGTPDGVIYQTALLSGDSEPKYMDEAPATFLVYDGPAYRTVNGVKKWMQGGHQLKKELVRKMGPAGVLGLPCSAIQLADGSFLGTCADNEEERKILLVVADDLQRTLEVTGVIVDDGGEAIVDDQGNAIEYVSSIP